MRILQVTSLFSPDRVGGAEIFVEDLARGLAGKGHTIAVAAISRERQTAELRDGFAIHRLGHTTPFFIGDWERQSEWKRKYYKVAVQIDPRLVQRLARVIEDFRPDVVNTHSLSELTPLIWPMIGGRGIPLVHSCMISPACAPMAPCFTKGISAMAGAKNAGPSPVCTGAAKARWMLSPALAATF